ncbi:F-box domain-containing protein [Purpureocillium lavendulum]|uniref:F-box domain-containing protein n=1 Tax=Purpureocillium lavendulum TaxID=1247861 RepID=A0AB34FRQ6_9HYPO|nr:F-box domain-containing protein [Purpureocillium lavendulum]
MSDLASVTYPSPCVDDHGLDEKLPSSRPEPASNDCASPSSPASSASLGILDTLPLEILDHVLAEVDLRTVLAVRHVNRRARDLVDFSPTYRAVARFAENALCGALNIGCAPWVTCGALCDALCTPTCECCGDFAGYIYLLGCARVCFLCFTRERRYQPLRPSLARRKFGLDSQLVKALPSMRALPGVYTRYERKLHRVVLVDYESARLAGIARHGSEAAMRAYVEGDEAAGPQTRSTRLTASDTAHARRPKLEDPIDHGVGNPLRFAAVCRVPWLDKQTQRAEWGFHCLGCKYETRLPLHFRRKFTRASFEKHIEQCGKIVDGRHRPEVPATTTP